MILTFRFLGGCFRDIDVGDEHIYSNVLEVYSPSSGKHVFVRAADDQTWWEVQVQKLTIPGDS